MTAVRRFALRLRLDSWILALIAVVLAGLALRLYGIDWDEGADLHPDELFITHWVLAERIHFDWPEELVHILDPARSGLNPRSIDPTTGEYREFAYGALPLWITDVVAWALSRLSDVNWNATDRVYLVGRALSALFSALTILPIAAVGVTIGGRTVGLLAALFAALAPMSIQLAHYFTTDSWLTFFVSLCLLATVNAARTGGTPWFAAAGAAFGFAMASKGSVFMLAGPIAVAIAHDAYRLQRELPVPILLRSTVRKCTVAAVSAALAFFAFEPFALLRPAIYLQSIRTQADIANGSFDVPFTRVYVGTPPIFYQLEQFVRWGYGPIAGLLALAGVALLTVLAFRRDSVAALILVTWAVSYGVVLAVSSVKFLRYLEPLSLVFAVAAALALVHIARFLHRAWLAPIWGLVPPLALILTFLWTGAFMSIYAHEHTRLSASRWIYESLPPGSVLTAEYWDDSLPRQLDYGLSPAGFGFQTNTLDLYKDLPPRKASSAIFAGIQSADYVIQSSRRVEDAVRAAPWRYPVQGRFFDQLARGRLAFDLSFAAERWPELGPIRINDRASDESFKNYDHPDVAIYERSSKLSRTDYDAVMSWGLQRPWFPSRESPEPTLLLDGPVGENPSVNDARWSAALTDATTAALVVWIIFLLGLQLIGFSFSRLLLGSFADQGWGVARVLALSFAAYPVWLGASLHLTQFRVIWVMLALALVGVVGWWTCRRYAEPKVSERRNRSLRPWIHAEVAFWLVFLLFLAFRFVTPDSWHPLWGGEKPMEFAQINAIGHSAFFPPFDPWYADGYVNYYYYGFYLIAFLLKATGIPTEIGFNLALPAVMAMLASGGFSVAAALSGRLTRSPRLGLLGGWCTVLALSLLGNLSALRGLFSDAAEQSDPFVYWTWNGSRAIDDAITEFPFFTGLYADLHAHVIALPITVAIIALCLATATWARFLPPKELDTSAVVPIVVRCATLALLLGSLSATNSWDVPVYTALAVVSTFMATRFVSPGSRRALIATAVSLAVVVGARLMFLPFHRHFVALFGQLAVVRDPTDLTQFLTHFGGLIAITSVGLTVLLAGTGQQTSATALLPWIAVAIGAIGLVTLGLHPGSIESVGGEALIVLAISGPPLAFAWHRISRWPRTAHAIRRLVQVLFIGSCIISTTGFLSGRVVFALLLLLGCAAGAGWLCLQRPIGKFACLLLAAGFLTAAGAEVVVVADDLIDTSAYRMNTIFKFYNQVWIFLALAGSSLVALMLREVLSEARWRPSVFRTDLVRLAWSRLGISVAALTLLASLTYPLLATGPRLAQRIVPGMAPGSLDALAWMESGSVPSIANGDETDIRFNGDLAAIEWLLANVTGTPVIAEASIGPYRCNGSRISAATGLPTIIGWERHEQQQRYPDTLPPRVDDVRTLYTSRDTAEKASILRRYNVEYVVVGDIERQYPIPDNQCTPTGSAAGIAAFDDMIGTTLEIAFSAAGTTVYRVLPVIGA